MLHAIAGEYPGQFIDYSKALVSIGQVVLPDYAEILNVPEGILFTWLNDLKGNPSDSLMVVANIRGTYNTTCKQTGAERRDGRFLWKIDLGFGELLDVWMVFRDYKERGYSNSLYLGALNNEEKIGVCDK